MRKSLVIPVLVLSLLIIACASLNAATNLQLFVNHQEVKSDVAPQIINNRVMVPARALAEALGARVDWIADQQKVAITTPDQFEQWDALFNDAGGSQTFYTQAVHKISDRYLLIEQGSDLFKGEKYFWLWDKELKQRAGMAAEYTRLESITAQQIVFTVKSGTASGNLGFPYRYVVDLATGVGKNEPLYPAQDVAFGSGAAWTHNLDAIEVKDSSVKLGFVVPEDVAQVGGNRTPLTTVDYAGDELTLRIYGIREKAPTIQPFTNLLVTKIETSWLPEGQPHADLAILQSDFPYGNQWTKDASPVTTQPCMVVKIKFAENVRFNVDPSGEGHTINFVKK